MSILTASGGPLVRTSLAELVYNQLLEGILSGALSSGAPLNIADIAKDLQVSPSPVREAMLRLAAEGLATNQNNRRATVISFTSQDVTDIFQVREFLECGAARLAAHEIDSAGLEELQQAAEQCAALYGDPAQKKAALDLDNRFHLLVAEASGNRVLREEVVRINRRVRIMQWMRLDPGSLSRGYPEHLEVIRALKKHDAEAAAAAMGAHIRAAMELVLQGVGLPKGDTDMGEN